MIMRPGENAILRYATTTSMTALLTVKTVKISIVNTDGYILSDIVVSVVHIYSVLLAS
jgi:hypothetical protein